MVSLNCRSHTPSASTLRLLQFEELLFELRALLQTTDERVSKRNLQAALAAAEPETRQPPRRKVVKRRRRRNATCSAQNSSRDQLLP